MISTGRGKGRSGPRRACVFLAALATLWSAAACGGGSPSDIVLPEEVEVSLTPVASPASRAVTLTLAATTGRDLSLQLVAVELAEATGVAFELSFDPALLEFRGLGPGAYFGENAVLGSDVVEDLAGHIVGVAGAADQSAGRSGSGTLLTLQFRLRQLRDGQSTLTFELPQSIVYGVAGPSSEHTFVGARLDTRIREPS
jgi:hypothetical protein